MPAFIDDGIVPGAWADALRFAVNVRVLPDMPLQSDFELSQGGPDARPAVCASFHSAALSQRREA